MIYGSGDAGDAYGPSKFISSARESGKVLVFGGGEETRDYVFVRDMVEICASFALGKVEGVYNVASGSSVSFQNVLGILRKTLEADFHITTMERDRPKTSQRVEIQKLRAVMPELRFTPLE